ncbi:MAG: ribbon-helix-helix protein, CopG family [Actinomycetota bacterium]
MKKDRTSVLLDKEIMQRLLALSRRENKSRTFLINEAVKEYVTKRVPKKKKMGIIGIADSKDPQFAENDEKYLEENGFGED